MNFVSCKYFKFASFGLRGKKFDHHYRIIRSRLEALKTKSYQKLFSSSKMNTKFFFQHNFLIIELYHNNLLNVYI